ncbi:hypothetical protein HAX54_009718 [Datura stramonium]|uniref:Uncharacterized protein n=1 Tax=Datura stramonium TaxID=4076 RepID=A0ABS8TH12_DATST|nr:hypothetical protein [Datura stramonium]
MGRWIVDLRAKLLQHKDKPAIINVMMELPSKEICDDLDIILQTLKDCGYSEDMFYIHCDAALCGLMVPFINNMISFKYGTCQCDARHHGEMLDNFMNELVQQRKQWYQGGGVEPPCVADDIGAQNCACSYHKIDYISS